jgi:hypothetical protein
VPSPSQSQWPCHFTALEEGARRPLRHRGRAIATEPFAVPAPPGPAAPARRISARTRENNPVTPSGFRLCRASCSFGVLGIDKWSICDRMNNIFGSEAVGTAVMVRLTWGGRLDERDGTRGREPSASC